MKELKLSEDERIELLSYYSDKLKVVENILHKLEGIKNKLVLSGYNPDWAYRNKVTYILKHTNKCMLIRDIVDEIKAIENLEIDPIHLVSSIVSRELKNHSLICKTRPYVGSRKYIGLKEWFVEDVVLPEYNPI